MLIDLLPAFSRFHVERFPASLVVLIPYGDIQGPRIEIGQAPTLGATLEPVYEGAQGGAHFLAFHIRAGGTPSYTDTDAVGWEFSIHITDEDRRGHSYNSVILVQEGALWVTRLRDCGIAACVDATIPEFDPTVRDNLAFDEGIGTHIPDVWERLMTQENSL